MASGLLPFSEEEVVKAGRRGGIRTLVLGKIKKPLNFMTDSVVQTTVVTYFSDPICFETTAVSVIL